MTTITTITEATDYITTALGEFADQYDVQAIADELTSWEDGKLVLDEDESTFWATCAKHELSC
jgi:hypothetical protein